MREPLTLETHQRARMVVDPLRLYDCCLISDGAAVVLVTRRDRARDCRQKPVRIAAMQGTARGARGIHLRAARARHQPAVGQTIGAGDAISRCFTQGIARDDVQGFYTYDAFSPLVLFALERFGYCGIGRGCGVRAGRPHRARRRAAGEHIRRPAVGSACGGLELDLRDDAAIARQRRREPDRGRDSVLQWGTAWGDSVILTRDA